MTACEVFKEVARLRHCKSAKLLWHHNIKFSFVSLIFCLFVILSFCHFVFLSFSVLKRHSVTDWLTHPLTHSLIKVWYARPYCTKPVLCNKSFIAQNCFVQLQLIAQNLFCPISLPLEEALLHKTLCLRTSLDGASGCWKCINSLLIVLKWTIPKVNSSWHMRSKT